MKRVVEEPGQVEAYEVTAMHARVAGYVKSWSVNIGSKITQGQVMAEINVPEAEAEVEQKRAMVEQAQARRVQAGASVEVGQADVLAAAAKLAEARAGMKRVEADVNRWRAESARVEQLFRERAQTGTLVDETRSKLEGAEAMREEVEARVKTAQAGSAQAAATLDKAKADLAATAAGIAVARAELRGAEALLAYQKILAPYDGVVTRRNVDVGHLTVPGGQGEPLFVVSRSGLVTVAVAIPEMFAVAVEAGDRATIRIQAIPGKPFEGRVTRTAYALDVKSRTLRAEVDLPNPDGKLHPGLYAYASIVAEDHPDALTIPSTAVVKEAGKAACFVVVNGRVAKRTIEIGLADLALTEVVSGIEPNDSVVKVGVASLVDGQVVEVTKPVANARP
jgi:RND family efflux transporter MFP subunit